MSIDLANERLLTFDEAAELLPPARRPSHATWWRWWRHGVQNVRLETAVVGGRRYTTRAAVERFAASMTEHRERQVQLLQATVAAPQLIATADTSKVGEV
ncbi:MAG: hypothetical protein C0483_04675 [Pirellula sp.]|nr:hypothetical protein [Pirellula sp.]